MGGKDDKSDRNVTDADAKCPENLVSKREQLPGQAPKALEPGVVIGKKWKIVRQIDPELGFNTIYVVQHEKKGHQAALKIEQKGVATPILRFETFVLLQMENKGGNTVKRFCRLMERGTQDNFNWIVVTLSGKNLKTLRKETEQGKLSPVCGFSVATQCLHALEDLHKLGFCHRTVNPSDFAIGRSINGDVKELRCIYLLDFGFARQFLDHEGKHKPPRPKPWVYKGSARHAPRNAYLNRELSRLDDLEMWLYMTVELVKGSLPWVAYRDPKQIFEYQKAVRTGLGLKEFLGGLPEETTNMMKLIDSLQYKEEPKYTELYNLLAKCIKICGGNEFPYDWEAAELAAAKAEAEGAKPANPEKK